MSDERGWTSESPTKRWRIETVMWEAFNTHWVSTPTLVDASGKTLLAFGDHRWSLDEAKWLDDDTVAMTLRRYPGNHTPADLVAIVDCEKGSAKVGDTDVSSLAGLEPALNAALTWRYG